MSLISLLLLWCSIGFCYGVVSVIYHLKNEGMLPEEHISIKIIGTILGVFIAIAIYTITWPFYIYIIIKNKLSKKQV